MATKKWAPTKVSKLPQRLSIAYLGASLLAGTYFVRNETSVLALQRLLYTFVIALAFYAIWKLLAKVYADIMHYTKLIKGSREQPAFLALARATLVMFISLTITAFLNVIRIPLFGDRVYEILTVTLYYASGLLAVYYFYYVGKSGHILARYVKRDTNFLTAFVLFVVVIGGVCLWIWRSVRHEPVSMLGNNHILSYVSGNVVLYSLLLPLIVMWAYGMAGAYGFYLFERHNKGVIYKRSFACLAIGVVTLVVLSVSRHMSDYFSGSASQLSLSDDFMRIVGLLGLGILSVLWMRRGLSKLLKIEAASKK